MTNRMKCKSGFILILGILLSDASFASSCEGANKGQKSLQEACVASQVTSHLTSKSGSAPSREISKWCACVVVRLDWKKATNASCGASVSGHAIVRFGNNDLGIVSECGPSPI